MKHIGRSLWMPVNIFSLCPHFQRTYIVVLVNSVEKPSQSIYNMKRRCLESERSSEKIKHIEWGVGKVAWRMHAHRAELNSRSHMRFEASRIVQNSRVEQALFRHFTVDTIADIDITIYFFLIINTSIVLNIFYRGHSLYTTHLRS